MDDTWNNVELTSISRRKSYTLNHSYDSSSKYSAFNNNENEKPSQDEEPSSTAQTVNGTDQKCLQPGSDIKPNVANEQVESLLRRLFGITIGEMKELLAYDDRNYFIKEDPNIKNPLIVSHCPHGYVLKILNALDSKKEDFVDAQNQLMLYLSKYIECPRPVANVNAKLYSVENINGTQHIVRLLEFVPGKMFHEVPTTNYLLYQSGEYLAKMVKALKNFQHEAYDSHTSTWQLQSVPQIKKFLYVLEDHSRKALVEEVMEAFEKTVLSKLDTFEMQIIHGDFNEQNIIVEPCANGQDYKIKAVIDFGDTNKSPILFEIGIALTYMLLQAKSLESGGVFLAGFETILPLNAETKSYLKYCVAARLAQSLVMGAYTHSLHPSNEYVLVTQEQGWKLIEELWREKWETIDDIWKTSCDNYLQSSVK
ncbi:hydroxylysine kinase [Musca domestica]|uniref:Hydroxylysine kinase n=1 Tax=Musca domestica TaxID=7370 RepID=T1PHJ4_MUSDO|nr:hydroxylysine kinase [Musca domestica]XP_005182631.1 hydroxylysine kinase [Musca domestica]